MCATHKAFFSYVWRKFLNMYRFSVISSFLALSCFLSLASYELPDHSNGEPTTDYSINEYWLSLPSGFSKDVDVFYVYPTSWYKLDPAEPDFCAIDHPTMLSRSKVVFDIQATAFETVGNLYAPYYRQADAAYTLSLPADKRWAVVDSIPAKDVIAAFDYYIKHYNKGKPYILVGHSQGAQVLMLLLKNYMPEHTGTYARMVCAYVIGYPVTAEFMSSNKHLKFAESAEDTGVIVSYNTQSPSVAPGANIVMANEIGLVINPINWKKDETQATTEESLGSYMPIDDRGNFGLIPRFADARINLSKGVVECSSVNETDMFNLSGSMGPGIYHSFDIPFYYYNLRENALFRFNRFLEK